MAAFRVASCVPVLGLLACGERAAALLEDVSVELAEGEAVRLALADDVDAVVGAPWANVVTDQGRPWLELTPPCDTVPGAIATVGAAIQVTRGAEAVELSVLVRGSRAGTCAPTVDVWVAAPSDDCATVDPAELVEDESVFADESRRFVGPGTVCIRVDSNDPAVELWPVAINDAPPSLLALRNAVGNGGLAPATTHLLMFDLAAPGPVVGAFPVGVDLYETSPSLGGGIVASARRTFRAGQPGDSTVEVGDSPASLAVDELGVRWASITPWRFADGGDAEIACVRATRALGASTQRLKSPLMLRSPTDGSYGDCVDGVCELCASAFALGLSPPLDAAETETVSFELESAPGQCAAGGDGCWPAAGSELTVPAINIGDDLGVTGVVRALACTARDGAVDAPGELEVVVAGTAGTATLYRGWPAVAVANVSSPTGMLATTRPGPAGDEVVVYGWFGPGGGAGAMLALRGGDDWVAAPGAGLASLLRVTALAAVRRDVAAAPSHLVRGFADPGSGQLTLAFHCIVGEDGAGCPVTPAPVQLGSASGRAIASIVGTTSSTTGEDLWVAVADDTADTVEIHRVEIDWSVGATTLDASVVPTVLGIPIRGTTAQLVVEDSGGTDEVFARLGPVGGVAAYRISDVFEAANSNAVQLGAPGQAFGLAVVRTAGGLGGPTGPLIATPVRDLRAPRAGGRRPSRNVHGTRPRTARVERARRVDGSR
jgi:hypothetical protein